ncbi:MAG: SPASM domain-containing protein, partial [Firmicutes bacterium]|nr:SPASM domain-containing protein [Bacillota bacterium]
KAQDAAIEAYEKDLALTAKAAELGLDKLTDEETEEAKTAGQENFDSDIEFYPMDFQNDGEYVGGCIAGGRNYFHINSNGDAEPCVFIHYSNANIHDSSILEILQSPLFMAYHNEQPFNHNHLRPCPMLENPNIIEEMVHRTKAKSTNLESIEPVEDLVAKCRDYAETWKPEAERIWESQEHKERQYENYKGWKKAE